MKIKLFIILVFFSIVYSYASDVKFYSINAMYGISMRETGTICKDDNGFIWTSSKTGVLRITEGDFRIYQLPYKTPDVLFVKLAYKNSQLYAYTINGQLFSYDPVFDRFNLLADLRTLFNENFLVVSDMKIQDDGTTLWFATSAGVYRYKNGASNFFKIKNTQETRSIDLYGNDNLFFQTQNGLNVINTTTLKTSLLHGNPQGKVLNVSKFYYNAKKERLWIGTVANGLFYYNLKKRTLEKVPISQLPQQPILAITQNSDSTILVGIDGQGIWKLSDDGKSVLNIYKEDVDNPTSLPGDGVYDLFCDENKRVWISTYSGGLSFFDQQSPLVNQITHRINIANSLSNSCVNKVLEDKRGNIWFATNNGISRWNMASNQWSTFYQNKKEQAQVFLALAEDNDGNIWGGTYSSGVYVLDGVSGKELMHFSQGWQNTKFSANYIFNIFKDSQGDIWLGGIQSDVICYQPASKKFRAYSVQPVKAIAELSPGKMLLGCTYGLLLLNKNQGNIEYLLNGYILHDILKDGKYIWLASSGDGLMRYNYFTRELTKFTTESGLPSNYVNSVILADGYLWVGTENGLCRFNPKDEKVLTFSSVFSLSNLSFNAASKSKLQNGDLIFGSNNGAVMFNPEKLYQSSFKGHIFFQDIKLSGRSIRENTKLMKDIPLNQLNGIKLKHNQNTLEIELLPIGVSSTGFKYSWKMEKLDNNWSQPSNRKIITYTNLPSGNFKLVIKMYDSSLSKVIDERTFRIHIIPPFWGTWWFRLILFLLIGGIVYFGLRTYTNHLRRLHNEDKINFFTTTTHDIRTSLTLINAPIEELNKEKNLSEHGRYYVNLATEQVGHLSFVATQLLDFQKVDVGKGQLFLIMVDIVSLVHRQKSIFETAAKKKNIEIRFSCNKEFFNSAIDELKITKVVNNLISNAVKYSNPNSKIDIILTCNNTKNWILEVTDYGLGISESAQKKLFREFYRGDNVVNSKMVGSGIGLLLVKNYVSMHNGDVSLRSKENEGSTFKITIPYKEVLDVSTNEDENNDETKENVIENFSELSIVENENSNDKKSQLLIVEDNNDLQEFLKHAFESEYKILIAGDGKQAWDLIMKKNPDLVISDIMMPEMDGFELCKLMKSTFGTAHIPIILLTALSEKTQKLEGLKLGADDYITKPFDMPLLRQRIKSIILNREIVRDRALKLIKQPNNEEPILTNEINDRFVKNALDIVRQNMANSGFGKDEFASAMNASSSLLYKKIKSLTGQSPIDFIKTIRLDHSLELLQSRKHTVTEVSELCGFSSVGYFSTVFKKHFGKSPTEV